MTLHDLAHDLAFIKYNIEQAFKSTGGIQTTVPGINVREHIMAAINKLDEIDNKISREIAIKNKTEVGV